jgi:hypothetical protein
MLTAPTTLSTLKKLLKFVFMSGTMFTVTLPLELKLIDGAGLGLILTILSSGNHAEDAVGVDVAVDACLKYVIVGDNEPPVPVTLKVTVDPATVTAPIVGPAGVVIAGEPSVAVTFSMDPATNRDLEAPLKNVIETVYVVDVASDGVFTDTPDILYVP